jgi:metallophosphoesterase (TIGR03768 family)
MFCLIFLIGMLVFSFTGCSSSNDDSQEQLQGYPISSEVLTTRERTVVPGPTPSGTPIYFYELAKYEQYGYGNWSYGQGTDVVKRTDIMPEGFDNSSVTNVERLLNYFVITDIHITDKESPAQRIYYGYKGGSTGAYSGTKLYSIQVFDAAIQTINALHKRDSFDFGLSLGDACDNTQYNELRWFLDVMDGKDINPASSIGIKQDPVPGPYNDYEDKFKAAGLDKSLKWYQVIGNHDHFWGGSLPLNDYVRQIYIGTEILNLGSPPTSMDTRGYYMGSIDGRTVFGDIYGVGPENDFANPPQVLAANPDRHGLSRNEWIGEFFNTTSEPVGHGFSKENAETGFACYSFKPKSGIPIKIIMLDDTQSDDVPNSGQPYAFGYLDQERFDWLVSELDKGQADGELMLIAAHVPIGVGISPSSTMSLWSENSPISQETLISKLQTYPNLVLWMSGHRHCNVITPFKSPDPSHPELGFWQVETSSLIDFPQQFRTFNIVRNSDNTISIIAVDVDPAVKDGSLAAKSRSYGVATQQFNNNPLGILPSGSSNVELYKQLSTEMQAKLKKLAKTVK